jgi:hypothetical protein
MDVPCVVVAGSADKIDYHRKVGFWSGAAGLDKSRAAGVLVMVRRLAIGRSWRVG